MEYNKYPISHIVRLRMGSDGNGIRTLILVQGCPLRCQYCINPFTWNGTENPKLMSAEVLYEQVIIDRPYMLATNGGLIIGGGEPLLYPKLFQELNGLMDKGMTLYAETSFNIPYDNIKLAETSIDHFYVDIKTTDEVLYREYTKGELSVSFENLKKFIVDYGADRLTVRIPIIPSFTDVERQLESKKILESIGVKYFHLFKYKVPSAQI